MDGEVDGKEEEGEPPHLFGRLVWEAGLVWNAFYKGHDSHDDFCAWSWRF